LAITHYAVIGTIKQTNWLASKRHLYADIVYVYSCI